MKKSLKIVFIVVSVFSLLIPITYSYALSMIEPEKNEKPFFEISKTEVTKNEKVEMIINLDSIKFNEFVFELKSNEALENLETVQSTDITVEKNNKEIVMEINKTQTNVKTINLFYSVPKNKKVGDTIKFIATITSIVNSETSEIGKEEIELPIENEKINKAENKLLNENVETSTGQNKSFIENVETGKEEGISSSKGASKITKNDIGVLEETIELNKTNVTNNDTEQLENKKENQTQINTSKQETQSIELEIKIVEEKDNNKEDNNIPGTQFPSTGNNQQEIDNSKVPNQNNTTVQKVPNTYSNIQYSTMSNISINTTQIAKVTYNGSDNNYLSELTVDGYTLNREFSKENSTYFITVGNEVEKINVTADAEDDESTVYVYGNENLKEGTNKILITVTAENGNVRNYRIYITKNV